MADVATIISVIQSIYKVYEEVKANKKRCARLCERLRALQSALKELKNQNYATLEEALEITLKVVQDAKKLVEKFTTAKWYIKAYGAATGGTKDDFKAINERLQGCVQALHLTATVKVLFNTTEEDEIAHHADMKEMQLLLESLAVEQGQTQEDLVAINTALDKVGIEIQNEFIVINDQLRRGNQNQQGMMHNQQGMMQKMEKQEALLQQLLKKDQQRVQQSIKPKITVLELNSNDIIFGEFIGRGGFGVVYKGTWNGVAVALKTFPSNAVGAKTLEDLRKIALKHQQIKNHPNIISFYGVCLEPSDKACLVIEFASGGTLFDRIYKNAIDISTCLALAYALELIAGLGFLHKNSIYHRDLKSLNVLIAAGGILKLSDFDLAKVKSAISSATSTKSSGSIGTWAWMAPEQHDPEIEKDWEKTDVYSLGMVFFEIVTRKQPWDGLNPMEIMMTVSVKKKRPEIATSDESRHKVLVAILKKCWNQDATQRPSLKDGDIQERIATTLKQLGGDPRQAANVVDISPAVPVSTDPSQKQAAMTHIQAAMMQQMEELLNKNEQRVQQSKKPKVTVLELNSNDIIFGEFIGRGGFGKVYKGTWNGVPVALKTLSSNAVDAKTLEDLRKGSLKHQQMNHPNIISFYGVCLDPAKVCLVTEFASGGTLFDRIYKNEIDISTCLALAYALELIAGLRYLHENGICHRDLKSPNVLIAAGGILKLSDFGLAKVKSIISSASTASSGSIDTCPWMAPEQHDPDAKKDWEKTDVYSLGMVFFEIVTRKQPWDGLNPMEIMMTVSVKKKRPEIATSDESRHKVLVAILKKCWNQDATQRPSLKDGDIQERIATTLLQLGGDPRQAANVVDISPAVPVSTDPSQKQEPPPPPPRRHVPEPPRPTQSSAVQNVRPPEHLLSRWEWLRKLVDNDPSLSELDLSSKNIGDEGAKALATALATNTSLQKLYLGSNNIGAEGAKAIATALATNTSLKILYLKHNNIKEGNLFFSSAKSKLKKIAEQKKIKLYI